MEKTSKGTFIFIFSECGNASAYHMIGIFTLYFKDVKTGYGRTGAESADLYGTFIASVF
ncbi:MAG: hypothetical protein ACTHLE_08750 [Agriterribacter sp.]